MTQSTADFDTRSARSPLPSSLAGADVLVLGGSSGIGLATARLLLEVGANVTVTSRSAARLAAVTAQFTTDAPATAVADVTDPASLDALFAGVGDLDHVFVVAGGLAAGPVTTTPASSVGVGIDERIWGTYEITKRAVPRLRPGGSLTFTSGPSAVKGIPGLSISSAYNAGLEGMVRALAAEIAPLRANVIRPGQTDTAFLHGFLGGSDDATVAAAGAQLLLGRVGSPAEVAAAVLFVMSNPYVTGSTVAVDGGLTL